MNNNQLYFIIIMSSKFCEIQGRYISLLIK